MPDKTAMIRCKNGLRHAWDDHDGSGFRAPEFGNALHYMCLRCTMIRRDIVNRFNGELLTRRYYPPLGYKEIEREQAIIYRQHEIKMQRAAIRSRKRKAS